MKLRPLHDRVLVRRVEQEAKTTGGIIIPDTAQEKPMEGDVIAVGPGIRATPTMPGQDAFGAIQEIVQILEADPKTDWSKVDLERLRRHLIDMNEVTLKADSAPKEIDGGLEIAVTTMRNCPTISMTRNTLQSRTSTRLLSTGSLDESAGYGGMPSTFRLVVH
jgi:hypothetical protein